MRAHRSILCGRSIRGDRRPENRQPVPVAQMPVKDGLEVLRWLHRHPELPRKLPVVVLSAAEIPSETQLSYAWTFRPNAARN